MSQAQITNLSDIFRFIQGGNATFTLISKKTGVRFTYKAKRPDGEEITRPIWISVLSGSDNESSFSFMGSVFPNPDGREWILKSSPKSRVTPSASSYIGIQWLLFHLSKGQLPETVEFWHEGKCCRCGRKLTVPESIAQGIGPECIKHAH